MRRRLALLLAAAVAAGAEPAWACTSPYHNPFADLERPPASDLVRDATFIDWVVVEASGPPACEPPKRQTSEEFQAEEAAWEAWEAAPDPKPEPPGPMWGPGGLTTTEGQETRTCVWAKTFGPIHPLKARVVESIRSGGSPYFSLAFRWDRSDPWKAYSDPRVQYADGLQYDREASDRALAWHQSPGFLDHGDLTRLVDGTDSCGGFPTAFVGERYLVFRSDDGGVMAMEPVRDRDDLFLDRVRRLAAKPRDFAHPALSAEAFFRASPGVALVRLKRCAGGAYRDLVVEADVLRGGFNAGPMKDWVETTDEYEVTGSGRREDGPSFNWLAEYLTHIKAPCRAGMTLLVISGPFDPDQSPPRAARVSGKNFRLQDIVSGYDLQGADLLSVDQAFAWVEAGQAAGDGKR